MSNDVANLLGKFGLNAKGYLEVDNTIDYKELPQVPMAVSVASDNVSADVTEVAVAAPILVKEAALTSLSVAVEGMSPALVERVEPVMNILPGVADEEGEALPVKTSDPVNASSLRSLLNEAALKRQAGMQERDADASRQSLLTDAHPITPAQVIAIISPKGGVGKSAMCAALAGTLRGEGNVIAIDLDPQNTLQYYMGASTDVAGQRNAGMTGGDWRSLLRDGAAGTRVLPYGLISENERRVLEHALEEDPHWLGRKLERMHLEANDVVILDTPAGRTPYLEQVLNVADQVVLVVTPDAGSFMALDHIDRLFDDRANNFGRVPCSYVINQFDASRTFCQDMLEVLKHRLGTKLIGVVPLDHTFSESLAFGSNLLLKSRQSPALQEIHVISDLLKADVQTSALPDRRAS